MWLRLYLMALVAVILSLLLYVGLLPTMVSARDSLAVVGGIFIALAWPAFVIIFFYKRVRKLFKCVKF